MKIVKSQLFLTDIELTKFINDNQIERTDILSIYGTGSGGVVIVFYGDSETEEKTRNIWGKLKD